MAAAVNLFSRCLARFPQPKYSALQSNEAGHGIDEAENWVRLFPVNTLIYQPFDYKKVDAFVRGIIADLKKIPITSQNIVIIERHLVEAGAESSWVAQELFDQVLRLNIDKGHRERLCLSLAHIYTDKP